MYRKALTFLLFLLLPAVAQATPIDFTFTAVDGITYSAAKLRGQPVVVHFGSHW